MYLLLTQTNAIIRAVPGLWFPMVFRHEQSPARDVDGGPEQPDASPRDGRDKLRP